MNRLLVLLLACLLVFGGLLLAQEGGDEPIHDAGWYPHIVDAVHGAVETIWVYWFPPRDEWGDVLPSLPGLPPPSGGGGGGPINSTPPPPPPPETDEAEICLELINRDIGSENYIRKISNIIKDMKRQGYTEFDINGNPVFARPGHPAWDNKMKFWLRVKRYAEESREEIKDEVEDCLN